MNDSTYYQLADALMLMLEERLDAYDGNSDIDYETQGGVMTLSFENGSKIIINRQAPLHQIWLAAKSGGYHFCYEKSKWICDRSGTDFWQVLSEACSLQAGEKITL